MHNDRSVKWRWTVKGFRNQPVDLVGDTADDGNKPPIEFAPNAESRLSTIRPSAALWHRLTMRGMHYAPLIAHKDARHTWNITPNLAVHLNKTPLLDFKQGNERALIGLSSFRSLN